MSKNNSEVPDTKKDNSDNTAVASILLLVLIVSMLLIVYIRMGKEKTKDVERIRIGAAALESSGLASAALDQYDRYRIDKQMDIEEEADLLFKEGKIAEEVLFDWERALEYYTLAAIYSPKSEWANDAGRRRFVCMEKLGKSKQAQSLLMQMTDDKNQYNADAYKAGGVVAVIDGRSVYWHEVRAAMINDENTDALNDLKTRKELLNQYVFSWILAEEAIKSGVDKEPKTIIMVEQSRRDALSRAYIGSKDMDMGDKTILLELWNRLSKLHEAKIFDDAVPKP